MQVYMLIVSIILPLFVLFGPKGMLTVRIVESLTNKSLGALNIVQCYVPYYNSKVIWKKVYGSSKFLSAFSWAAFGVIILSIVIRFAVPNFVNERTNAYLQLFMTFLLIALIAITYIVEVVIHVKLCKTIDKRVLMLFGIIPALGNFLMLNGVAPYFKKFRETLDNTFGQRA